LTVWQIFDETLLWPKKGRVTGNSFLQNHECQTNPLQNWRGGSLAESRICHRI
jgi:predicted SprT family Zn-dependent metalloprotease